MISAKAAPLTLISSTMPSNPVVAFCCSRLNRLRKLSCPPPAGIEIFGEMSSELLAVVISEPNASFGAEDGLVVEVTHAGKVPVVTTDDQPTGRAGAVTLSKFSLQSEIGVAVGVVVAVCVAVPVGVDVFVRVAVFVGVKVFVGVGDAVNVAVGVDVFVAVPAAVGVANDSVTVIVAPVPVEVAVAPIPLVAKPFQIAA